jgi:hypothetical protein
VTAWTKEDWELLARLIHRKQCTPFVGAGASWPTLPLGHELAEQLAEQYGYPCSDKGNLTRVAQWAVTQGNEIDLKGTVKECLSKNVYPDFKAPDEPHRLLVDLGLPVYITTNYDDFLIQAFKDDNRPARSEICQWHLARKRNRNLGYSPAYTPTPENPLVFHLHGALDEPLSMVLTEDDYLDFLIYVQDLLPPSVEKAFSDSALLFLGYSLSDMNFKVLFRKLASYPSRGPHSHFAVQLDPVKMAKAPAVAAQELRYLQAQYDLQSIKVFWGTCREFVAQLRPYL